MTWAHRERLQQYGDILSDFLQRLLTGGQKPSPHRFLSTKKSDQNVKKVGQPPPRGSNVAQPGDNTHEVANSTHPPSTPQFGRAPRFATPRSKPAEVVAAPTSTSAPRFGLLPSQRYDAVEDADLAGYDDDGEDLLAGAPNDIVPTLEYKTSNEISGAYKHGPTLPHSPKRRRFLEPGTDSTQASTHSATPARFLIPEMPDTHTDHAGHCPSFLRSSIPPSEAAEPLPTAFSPHRRGQRFVPGGMAAELSTWINEAGSAASASRHGRGYLRGEDYVTKIKVDAVAGFEPGSMFIEGRTEGGKGVRVVLTDGNVGIADRKDTVREGDVVGIRAPTWDVFVDGRTWSVGVDWKVLDA